MRKRRSVISLALFLTAFALLVAGCGGGEDTSEPAAPEPATTAPAEPAAAAPAEPPTPAAEPPAEKVTVASEVPLAADPSGQLAYDQSELNAFAGEVSITLSNDSSVPHNVVIADGAGNVLAEGETFSGGGTRTTTATLEPGTYTFFCSVPGHRQAGMEGTLTVSPPPSS